HPTQKPAHVVRRLVRALSYRGSVVLDVFAGSGVTTRVAIEEGRHSLACDVDPRVRAYVDAQRALVGDAAPPHEMLDAQTLARHPIFARASGSARARRA